MHNKVIYSMFRVGHFDTLKGILKNSKKENYVRKQLCDQFENNYDNFICRRQKTVITFSK